MIGILGNNYLVVDIELKKMYITKFNHTVYLQFSLTFQLDMYNLYQTVLF